MSFYSTGKTTAIFDGVANPRWESKGQIAPRRQHNSVDFDWQRDVYPLIVPAKMLVGEIRWVAPMLCTSRQILMPVLTVTASGTVVGDAFVNQTLVGHDALVITRARTYETRVIGSVSPSIRLAREPEGESKVILAPDRYAFEMLPLLMLEQGTAFSEWRNWTNDMHGTMHSYHGNPFRDITESAEWVALDFAPYVSPLATGIVGSIQAFSMPGVGASSSAYIYVGRDAGNHVLAQAGLDRAGTPGMGMTSMFSAAFGIEKRLWCKVTPATIGRVTLLGWKE